MSKAIRNWKRFSRQRAHFPPRFWAMSYITSLWMKTAIPEKKVYNYIPRERDEPRRFFPLGPAAGGKFSEMELSRRHFPYINSYFSIFCKHSVRISVRKNNRKRSIAKSDFWKFSACGGLWGNESNELRLYIDLFVFLIWWSSMDFRNMIWINSGNLQLNMSVSEIQIAFA